MNRKVLASLICRWIDCSRAILHYVCADVKQNDLKHINKISRIEENAYVWMDRFTIRNLELYGSPNPNAITLLDVIDRTITAMGGRTLKRWLALPLKDKNRIDERLNIVEQLSAKSKKWRMISV